MIQRWEDQFMDIYSPCVPWRTVLSLMVQLIPTGRGGLKYLNYLEQGWTESSWIRADLMVRHKHRPGSLFWMSLTYYGWIRLMPSYTKSSVLFCSDLLWSLQTNKTFSYGSFSRMMVWFEIRSPSLVCKWGGRKVTAVKKKDILSDRLLHWALNLMSHKIRQSTVTLRAQGVHYVVNAIWDGCGKWDTFSRRCGRLPPF